MRAAVNWPIKYCLCSSLSKTVPLMVLPQIVFSLYQDSDFDTLPTKSRWATWTEMWTTFGATLPLRSISNCVRSWSYSISHFPSIVPFVWLHPPKNTLWLKIFWADVCLKSLLYLFFFFFNLFFHLLYFPKTLGAFKIVHPSEWILTWAFHYCECCIFCNYISFMNFCCWNET